MKGVPSSRTATEPDQHPASPGPGVSAVVDGPQRTRSGDDVCPHRQATAHSGASGLCWKNSSYRPGPPPSACQVTPSGSLTCPDGAVKWYPGRAAPGAVTPAGPDRP